MSSAAHLFGWPCKLQPILVCCNTCRRSKIFGKVTKLQHTQSSCATIYAFKHITTLPSQKALCNKLDILCCSRVFAQHGVIWAKFPVLGSIHKKGVPVTYCIGNHLPGKVIKSCNLISKSQTGKIRLESTSIIISVPLTFRQIFHMCSKKTNQKLITSTAETLWEILGIISLPGFSFHLPFYSWWYLCTNIILLSALIWARSLLKLILCLLKKLCYFQQEMAFTESISPNDFLIFLPLTFQFKILNKSQAITCIY